MRVEDWNEREVMMVMVRAANREWRTSGTNKNSATLVRDGQHLNGRRGKWPLETPTSPVIAYVRAVEIAAQSRHARHIVYYGF